MKLASFLDMSPIEVPEDIFKYFRRYGFLERGEQLNRMNIEDVFAAVSHRKFITFSFRNAKPEQIDEDAYNFLERALKSA